MVRVTSVDDPADERLRPYTRLTDAEHRRRLEDSTGSFVIEGTTAIKAALTSPYRVRSLLVTPTKWTALAPHLDQESDTEVFVASQAAMNAAVGFDIHRGAVAIGARLPLPEPYAVVAQARTVALFEGINDHENLGAIARSARALGVDALLFDPTCADPLYRRCVRVSLGHVLHIPFTRTGPVPATIATLADAGFTIVALTPAAGAVDIDPLAAALASTPVALVIGSEATGLSAAALAAADHRARVPMRAGVDSLNVGHAAAIAFHLFGRR